MPIKVAIVGNGVSGIVTAHKLFEHSVSINQKLDIIFIDPNSFGGNTYNRSDVTVGMANPISNLGIPYKNHAYDSIFQNIGFWKGVLGNQCTKDASALSDSHLTHNQYGMYLRGVIWDLLNQVSKHYSNIRIIKFDQKVKKLDEKSNCLELEDKSIIKFDKLILATGNVEPRAFKHLQGVAQYFNCDDTATDKKHAGETKDMVILGMGNGAHYTALNAFNNGFKGVITLVSKDGKKPLPNAKFGKPYQLKILTPQHLAEIKKDLSPKLLSKHINELFLQELKYAKQHGFDIYDVIDSASKDADQYWRLLNVETKEYLLKNLLVNFNNARFRIPEGHIELINKFIAEGRLIYRSGIQKIEVMNNKKFVLTFADKSKITSSKIVNNTGPSREISDRDDFMKLLEKDGIIQQHQLGGIKVTDDLRVIGKNGYSKFIYAVGPILSGEFLNAFTVKDIQTLVDSFLKVEDILESKAQKPRIRSKL